jgi:hypothetical protein
LVISGLWLRQIHVILLRNSGLAVTPVSILMCSETGMNNGCLEMVGSVMDG